MGGFGDVSYDDDNNCISYISTSTDDSDSLVCLYCGGILGTE